MMTRTDFEVTASALRDLPLGQRIIIYRRLCVAYGARPGSFDPERFGDSLNIPSLLRSANTYTPKR